MKHYRLGTELPLRPRVPAPPPMPLTELWGRCRDELPPGAVVAVEALRALDDVEAHDEGPPPADRMRERMEHVGRLAEDAGSGLLQAWVAYEVALREALAARRAADLGRPWSPPRPDVEDLAAALDPMVTAVMRNVEPLERQRALDGARLRELERLCDGDPFGTDALLASVLAAMVVDRWDVPAGGQRQEVRT